MVALEGIGAGVEPLAPGEACFEAGGLRRLHRGIEGVLSATRHAVAWPGLRLGVGPVRFSAQAGARRATARRASFVEDAAALRSLPIELLGTRERTAKLVAPLGRLGISTLGELVKLGRGPLSDRFGGAGVMAFDLASGIDGPVVPRIVGQGIEEEFLLPDALSGPLLERVLGMLLDRILARRDREDRTLRILVLEARLVEGGTWRDRVVLREATADPARLRLALTPHLLQLSAPAEVLKLRVEAFGGSPNVNLPLLQDDATRRRLRLREGVRQVRAGAGEDALLQVIDVDPESRLPERRMALAPADP